MGTPHKHEKEIKAWAEGADIERYINGKWLPVDPTWMTDHEYRVKPEEHTVYAYISYNPSYMSYMSLYTGHHGNVYTPSSNVKLTFNDEGVLVNVEMKR